MSEFAQETRDISGAVAGLEASGDRHEVVQEFPLYVVDSYRTVFGEDTFRAHWDQQLPALCWMHNLREPIGRATEAQVTTQAIRGERTKVAQVRSRFSRFHAVPLAERAFTQMDDGDLTDVSFGFNEMAPRQPYRAQGVRGAELVTRARMNETSPVTIGSIPGAKVVGIREEGSALAMPTLSEILELQRQGMIGPEAAAQLARDALPEGMREHITVSSQAVRHDPADDPSDDDPSPEQCAQALDAALDAAQDLVDGLPDDVVSGLPDDVQQALALMAAAGVAADALLDAMGVPDVDDQDGGDGGDGGDRGLDDQDTRASITVSNKPWSNFTESDYSPPQWKAACLVDTGQGPEDSKDRYALPVKEPDGTVNKNALSAAAGRLGQVKGISDDQRKAAAKALLSLYGKAGMQAPGALMQATRGDFSELPSPIVDEQSVREAEDVFARLD